MGRRQLQAAEGFRNAEEASFNTEFKKMTDEAITDEGSSDRRRSDLIRQDVSDIAPGINEKTPRRCSDIDQPAVTPYVAIVKWDSFLIANIVYGRWLAVCLFSWKSSSLYAARFSFLSW